MRTKHRSATIYNTTTRSRLEARWAIFFRELNLKWIYEPIALRGGVRSYTPDFRVQGFGYIEIKPTLELFIQESSERIAAVAHANPNIKIYGFCSDHVAIRNPVLYQANKLFAPTTQHIYGLLSYARIGGDKLSVESQNVDIQRAITIANATKFNEWQSMKSVLTDVIEDIARQYVPA